MCNAMFQPKFEPQEVQLNLQSYHTVKVLLFLVHRQKIAASPVAYLTDSETFDSISSFPTKLGKLDYGSTTDVIFFSVYRNNLYEQAIYIVPGNVEQTFKHKT
jgi:hypothetical protein